MFILSFFIKIGKYIGYAFCLAIPVLMTVSGLFFLLFSHKVKNKPEFGYLFFESDLLASFTIHPSLWLVFFLYVMKLNKLKAFLLSGVVLLGEGFFNTFMKILGASKLSFLSAYHLFFYINLVLITLIVIHYKRNQQQAIA